MLKRMVLMNRCTLCAIPMQIPLVFVKNHRTVMSSYEGFQFKRPFQPNKILKKNNSKEPRNRVNVRVKDSHVSAVRLLLERFEVDMNELNTHKSIFVETTYTIERRIMLLQELGVPKITISCIVNFIKGMYLPVDRFKANFAIDPDFNIAQNLLSYTENPNISSQAIDHLNESMTMKQYYAICFAYYLKTELDLDEVQVKRISYKKYTPVLYNSFRLVKKTLKIVRDMPFPVSLMIKNKYIFSLHPENALSVIDMIKSFNLPNKTLLRYPKLFYYDLDDLRTLLYYFKQYNITPQMIQSCYQIFHLSSAEFKRRVEHILSNPFTLVYQTHPRFLVLVRDYHIILPRIRYLQEKNLKFATIYTLTTFHNYLEILISKKKMNLLNIRSFLQSQFGLKGEELIEPIRRHACYAYAPLVQNYETLVYLKEVYPKEAIIKHIYAILYNKLDLQAAREVIMNDPEYSQWAPDKLLALCVYKIEEKCHFSGEAVLEPEKYAESVKEESSQDISKEMNRI
ncbi:uncharacterized protein LOC100117152 [Nasonia vitripennis]|uniref:Uncharacterized protein n=1 Tax=Nasonia vitripennis TaxID=7425 RepID=A0A7M7G3D8_NASVI|nr:uncharacterized protein LOC100117152 [Nasonia vitripennis]